MDAFVHIAEQYLTFPVGGEVQDRLAEGLLQVLVEKRYEKYPAERPEVT